MKQLISFILIFAIHLSVIRVGFVLLHYQLNKDLYSKVLCVQKEVKENTCQGHCQVTAEIKAIDTTADEKTPLLLPSVELEILYFQQNSLQVETTQITFLNVVHFTAFQEKKQASIYFAIFHPPQIELS